MQVLCGNQSEMLGKCGCDGEVSCSDHSKTASSGLLINLLIIGRRESRSAVHKPYLESAKNVRTQNSAVPNRSTVLRFAHAVY